MTNEEQLTELLLLWEERFEAGEELAAEELCRDCPELTMALQRRITVLKQTAWIKSPGGAGEQPLPRTETPFVPEPVTMAGRYRLEHLLAEGSFGQVWRGFDEVLQRPVAVKVPKKHRPGAEDEKAFLTEARKLARLKHPGIVAVHDVGRYDGAYFIVSELIDGQDLGMVLRQKPPALTVAVRIVAEIARHLHYAHQQGFVHRDVKPANILVDKQERIFLTDFGIALSEEELHKSGGDGSGTLAFMAPEQLQGPFGLIGPPTDIYSLGVVLYQMLTGQLPFDADTAERLRQKILSQEPLAPRSLRPGLPKEVERISLKCLAKSPESRYPSAQALADDLSRWANRRTTNRVAIVAMLVLIAFMGTRLVWQDRDAAPLAAGGAPIDQTRKSGPEESLFNGQDLTGWVAFKPTGENAFRVGPDNTLLLKGGPKGHLRTERMFRDFELHLEYMLPIGGRVTANGSGVVARMIPSEKTAPRYLEVNIGEGSTGDVWWAAGKRETRASLSNERSVGTWNELAIVCEGDTLTVSLNGKIVNKVEGLPPIAGHIGLLAQGTDVLFRQLRVAVIGE